VVLVLLRYMGYAKADPMLAHLSTGTKIVVRLFRLTPN
jgi:hypothetical protein